MKRITTAFLFLLWVPVAFCAQDPPPTGSIKVIGQTRVTGNKVVLDRKRFYLIRGGLDDHKDLIERLTNAEPISRDCYYANLKVSPQFMCWLKTEDYNCESPYCRKVSKDDVNAVPEFQTAYKLGLRQFGGREGIARDWLTTNLPFELREGFYRKQKATVSALLPYANPIQTIMTDTLLGTAFFVDIGLNLDENSGNKNDKESFLVTNLLPAEIDNKAYTWVCEVDVGLRKQGTLNLQAAEKGKKCVVITKDLPVCKTSGCDAK